MKIHIVKAGETLFELAKKYKTELVKLIALNPQIADPDQIQPGDKVKIPAEPKVVEVPADLPVHGTAEVKKHVVKQGDTLWKLSKEYNVSFQELLQANTHLKNPNVLMTGEIVYIPAPGKAAETAPAAESKDLFEQFQIPAKEVADFTAPAVQPEPVKEQMPPYAATTWSTMEQPVSVMPFDNTHPFHGKHQPMGVSPFQYPMNTVPSPMTGVYGQLGAPAADYSGYHPWPAVNANMLPTAANLGYPAALIANQSLPSDQVAGASAPAKKAEKKGKAADKLASAEAPAVNVSPYGMPAENVANMSYPMANVSPYGMPAENVANMSYPMANVSPYGMPAENVANMSYPMANVSPFGMPAENVANMSYPMANVSPYGMPAENVANMSYPMANVSPYGMPAENVANMSYPMANVSPYGMPAENVANMSYPMANVSPYGMPAENVANVSYPMANVSPYGMPVGSGWPQANVPAHGHMLSPLSAYPNQHAGPFVPSGYATVSNAAISPFDAAYPPPGTAAGKAGDCGCGGKSPREGEGNDQAGVSGKSSPSSTNRSKKSSKGSTLKISGASGSTSSSKKTKKSKSKGGRAAIRPWNP